MANEICVLESPEPNRYTVVYLFPITTPVQVGGTNIIPTPTSGLPPLGVQALTTIEKAGLDAGTLAFEIDTVTREAGQTPAQLQLEVQTRYAVALARFNGDYARQYQRSGLRVQPT